MQYALMANINKSQTPAGFKLSAVYTYELSGSSDDIDFTGYYRKLDELEETFGFLIDDGGADFSSEKETPPELYYGAIDDRKPWANVD